MILSKINIRNFRLLNNAELDVDHDLTLIVGRNNTAKTSCIELIEKVLKGEPIVYDDLPLNKRKDMYTLVEQFINKAITYDEFRNRFPLTTIEFFVDYSLDAPDANLGALSPFIIDVDYETTTAWIRAEYSLKMDEDSVYNLFASCLEQDGTFNYDNAHEICASHFVKMFDLTIYAVDPNNCENTQKIDRKKIEDLFPLYSIPAERILGEDGNKKRSSLGELITNFFSVEEKDLDPQIASDIKALRNLVENTNKAIQKQSNIILSSVVNTTIGFGYPNSEELKLGVSTKLQIDEQLKNQTELTYSSDFTGESLPSSHNGLGYKNLIKIEFMLADYAKKIKQGNIACIPLLFIEEPESHMHPQMQHAFADYLVEFLHQISMVHIQTFLTSHSPHIANTVSFSKIRYAQKTSDGVIYKNLDLFSKEESENLDFIKKYLTLSRCDLFFADKVILVEGASERLLIPDMIKKCDEKKLFDKMKYKLPTQYYTIIEVGGAYAHIFIPFINFLGIPCLILTDIDSAKEGKKSFVEEATTTTNATLKWWVREIKEISPKVDIKIEDLISLSDLDKTIKKCHLEFQIKENGICGRSLEEAIMNVNRSLYGIGVSPTEKDLEFRGKSKTDFALDIIWNNKDYEIPQYIKKGLMWLNEEKVIV